MNTSTGATTGAKSNGNDSLLNAESSLLPTSPEAPIESPIVFEGKGSIDRERREISAGILSDTRRRILELALLLEKGEATNEILEATKATLAAISVEIEKRKSADGLFNFPLIDQNLRIVFEDLPLLFEWDDEVQKALGVLQKTFRQKYNLVVVVDASRRAVGIISSAVLINSDPEELLKNVPIIKNGFAITLQTKPRQVTEIMDHLGVNALPVVDEKGIVIGIFTMRDHEKGVTALYSKKLKTEIETQAELGELGRNVTGEA